MHSCEKLNGHYAGKDITTAPELYDRVDKLGRNPKTWVTLYRCKECGQYWKEYYTVTGRGELPNIMKINPEEIESLELQSVRPNPKR